MDVKYRYIAIFSIALNIFFVTLIILVRQALINLRPLELILCPVVAEPGCRHCPRKVLPDNR